MLQRSYASFENQFGISNRQAKMAGDFLVEHGLIRKELRTIRLSRGEVLNNVLYIEPIPKTISKITFEDCNVWDVLDKVDQHEHSSTESITVHFLYYALPLAGKYHLMSKYF